MALGIKIPRNALENGAEKYKENPNGGTSLDLEPGTYVGIVKSGRGVETKKGPQIVFDIIVGGDVEASVKGGTVSIWFSFDEERIVYLFRFLRLLGYEVDDMDEDVLEDILEKIEDAKHVVRFKATERDGYINYRVNKLCEDIDPSEVIELDDKPKGKKGKAKDEEDDADEGDEDDKPKGKKGKAKDDDDADEGEEDDKPKGKKGKGAEPEPEEEVTVEIGMKCKTKIKGEVVKCEVVGIDEDEGKVIVKSKVDGKKYRVDPANLLEA